MMRFARSAAAAAFALLLAACTGGPGGAPRTEARETSSPPETLFLGTDRGPATVSLATGSVVAQEATAVPAPDGSRLYRELVANGSTRIEVMDAATGELVASSTLEGELDVRLASWSGELVALMDPLPPGVDDWTPVPRASTSILVADPNGVGRTRTYDLRGNFEPEAFAVDDSRLFLIEYLPAQAPSAYRVQTLDLATGRVTSVAGRFKTPAQRMPGIRLRQVYAPNGSQLYTLYSSRAPAKAPGYGSAGYGSAGYGSADGGSGYGSSDTWGKGDIVDFVHVLNLRNGWAFCVTLPKAFWDQPASAQAMAVSPDGASLYVVDSVRGIVADMDTKTLQVQRTGRIDLGADVGLRTSAQVSADGGTLFVGTTGKDGASVTAIDALALDVRDRWAMPGVVSGLGLSGDGRTLYVASGNRLLLVDPTDGSELTSVLFADLGSILRVGTPGV